MTKRLLTVVLSPVLLSFSVFPARTLADDTCTCSLVEQALHDIAQVKIGMNRSELEKYNFVEAGGLIFRSPTPYVYRKCDYIHVEISFTFDPTDDRVLSPSDLITKVSKLSLDYPAAD